MNYRLTSPVKNINIAFTAGQTVALVVVSGSGWSTMVSLIERFYDPLSGSVRLNGVDIVSSGRVRRLALFPRNVHCLPRLSKTTSHTV